MTNNGPVLPGRIGFGGDYYPEQWDAATIDADLARMHEAGVNLVTLGVFAWGLIEPAAGRYEFTLIDDVLDRLHASGIGVVMATPTASAPQWLLRAHPEILPMDRLGHRFSPGGRLGWCPSNPVWREYSVRISTAVAQRYGRHPAVRLWHINNEIGGGNRQCFCDESARAFREWLANRYGSAAALNVAWGTAVWGHQYGSLDEVLPPRDSESPQNPSLVLDFDRFSSDALAGQLAAEHNAVRAYSPDVPITTNMMIGPRFLVADYSTWMPFVDLVANDQYARLDYPEPAHDIAFTGDLVRGLRGGQPWILMETAPGGVTWQRRNPVPTVADVRRRVYGHLARGADAALFFQWRASRHGAEQFHSALMPHAGTDTEAWRAVVQLGAELERLGEIAGSVVEPGRVAVLTDQSSSWAWRAGDKPIADYPIENLARDYHKALWDRGIRCEVVPADTDLSDFDLVVMAGIFCAPADLAERLSAVVGAGGCVLVTALSGIVDQNNAVLTGGFPWGFRDVLGVVVEEIRPLLADETLRLDTGWTATEWTELVRPGEAAVVAAYADGPCAGRPAVTRRQGAGGVAWYISTLLDPASIGALIDRVLLDIPTIERTAPARVETVKRVGPKASYRFVINHGDTPALVVAHGRELITGVRLGGEVTVAAGDVAVVREDR